MAWFITSIILALIAAAWFFFAPGEHTGPSRNYGAGEVTYPSVKPFGYVPAAIAVICFVLSCFAVVGTRNVGVPTVFGKPTGDTYGAGLQFKAPWVSVTDIDATIQPEEYKGDSCIKVKIADGGQACVTMAYRWRINPDGADSVYADYRNSDKEITDAVRSALVSTNIKAAINEVFGKYDPLSGAKLEPGMSPEELANAKINVVPDYDLFNTQIQANVAKKIAGLGDLIEIQSITISLVELPEATQTRINQFNAAVQQTKIALQEVATKAAQASGNRELAKSLQDPNVLVSKCFDALASGDFTAPPGFSCWPGSNGSVVIPATK